MHDPAGIRDEALNPKFVYYSPVHFDELDPMQMLHNSRFATHIERAIIAFYATTGRKWEAAVGNNPDQFHVVRDIRIEYLNPVIGPGTMRIDVWVEEIGNTSCTYGFLCSSEDGNRAYARGERVIVKIDPSTHRPTPWSDFFRTKHSELLKDLPAYA